MVPPRWFHFARYLGLLARAAGWRDAAVPALAISNGRSDSASGSHAGSAAPDRGVTVGEAPEASRTQRLPWAQLLARVFGADALTCPRCGQPMRVLAAIQSPEAIRAILECLGLPARPPPVAPPALGVLLPADF